MLILLILLLISFYYLKHGLYPLLTGKPALQADVVRKTIVILVIVELIGILYAFFQIFVAFYGYSYAGTVVGDCPFYIILFLLCLLILWVFYRLENDTDAFKQSVVLVAVHPDYAMTAVRETLLNMSINFHETLSGFHIADKDLTVPITISGKRIRFNVNKPLDKIFLNQFCRSYQSFYALNRYPLARRFAFLSTGLGLAVLGAFIWALSESQVLFWNFINGITQLIAILRN